MKKKKIASLSVRGFNRPVNFIFNIVIAIFAISCVLPFLFVLAISLTKESSLQQFGYSFWPREWSFYAYRFLFDQMKDKILQSLFVTVLVTVLGTAINSTATSLYAYAISRNNFPYRRFFTIFCLITMLFSPGMIANYLVMTNLLQLKDTIWALILPMAVSPSVLAAFTLVACGSSAKSKSGSGNTTLHMYQIGDKPDNYTELMANANKILEKKAGVKLDISYIGWGDYAQKMNVIVSSGEAYDIAFAQDYATNAAKGAFADLTDLAPKYAKTAYNELNPAYIKGNKINGKLYGYPVNGNIYAQQVITFNKQYLDKYNLSIDGVNSFASAEKVIEEFHKKEPNVAAFAIGQGFKTPGNVDYVLGNGLPFAVDTTGDGKKIQNVYDIPSYIDNLKKMHDYYTKGLIPADAATSNTAFDFNSNNWFARVETQGPYDYGDTILTQAAGQTLVSKAVTEPLITTDQARVANFVVSNTSKHKEDAVKVLGLINSDAELLNGLVYGVEGQ